MAEELTKPQVLGQETVGAELPLPVTDELGAVAKPAEEIIAPKPKRTYSEDEWSKRESEKDKELAAYRQTLAQLNMQAQIQEATRFEQEAAAKDKTQVEQGLMTDEDAKSREQLRREQVQVHLAGQSLRAEQESIAKFRVAHEIAKEYGIAVDDLLNDKNINVPVDMVKKAASLSQKKLTERIEKMEAEMKALKEGDLKFDRGQQGTMADEKSLRSRYPTMYKK